MLQPGAVLESHLQALIGFFSEHPGLALGAVFAAALLEALAVIGTVIPGSTIVFLGGMLAGLQALNLPATAVAAVGGAVAGDGLSYWLGSRYRERLRGVWPMSAYPVLFDRGQTYFTEKGARSVFLARFSGPLRAIVPVIAGISGMPAVQFYVVNVLSAFGWSLAHLAPGFLFGASLQLAGAVSSRLAVLLILAAGTLWLFVKLVAKLYRHARPHIRYWRDRVVTWAGASSNPVAGIVASLFDPARAESKALMVTALLLIGSAWLFFGVLEDVLSNDPLVQVDRNVHALLQTLRTTGSDKVMIAFTELGSAAVVIPLVVVVSVWLGAKRCWHTLGYWLAAGGFAELLVWALKFGISRARPTEIYRGIERFSFPSGHATMNIVVYAFLAFLLAHGKARGTQIAIAGWAVMMIALISFSRLYLGVHWFSDVIAGLALGLAWVAMLSIAYLNHVRHDTVSAGVLSILVGLTLMLVGGLVVAKSHNVDLVRYAPHAPLDKVLMVNWQAGGWRELPPYRSELGGAAEEPLSVQWAGAAESVAEIMNRAGWRVVEPWGAKTSLLWLLPDAPIAELPVLPKFDYAVVQQMAFQKVLNADERLVLHLWPSRFVVASHAVGSQLPLWVGMVTGERLRHPAGLVTLAVPLHDYVEPLRQLAQDARDENLATQLHDDADRMVLLLW